MRPDAIRERAHDEERQEHEDAAHDHGRERTDPMIDQLLQDRVDDHRDDERRDHVAGGVLEQRASTALAVRERVKEGPLARLGVADAEAEAEDDRASAAAG